MKQVYQFVVHFQDAVMTVISDDNASAVAKVADMLNDGRPYTFELAGTFDFNDYGKLFVDATKPKVDTLESMALMLKDNGYRVTKKREKVK
jgi:hypothetical protein